MEVVMSSRNINLKKGNVVKINIGNDIVMRISIGEEGENVLDIDMCSETGEYGYRWDQGAKRYLDQIEAE
jgi:hypothetical protein